jgi:extracellular elastinolytic metalloproteinase
VTKYLTKTTIRLAKSIGFVVALACFCTVKSLAQAKNEDPSVIALDYLKANAKNWQLSKTDISEAAVQQIYGTDHNGVTHVWFIQRRDGIEVFNGLVNVNILPSGEVLFAGNRFISNLQTNANQPVITAANAIEAFATHLGMTPPKDLKPISADNKMQFTFAPNGIAHQNMHAKLRYQPIGTDGNARLAWDIDVDAINGSDHWTARIDALTSAILDKTSWTVHCNFDHATNEHTANCTASDAVSQKKSLAESSGGPLSINPFFGQKKAENEFGTQGNSLKINHLQSSTTTALTFDDGKYRALPIPNESPLHGSFALLQGVVDTLGSPFGWHDTTGTVGADFTITRGNNAHAYLDLKNYNRSSGDEPDGGALLNFDFPYNSQAQSDTLRNLAVTNLFYLNNIMHDVSYRYGFDEKAGNFQANNYGKGGLGRDFVNANAQDGGSLPDPTLNNANMSTPVDGTNGRMQMYLWSRNNAKMLRVTAPASIAGDYQTGTAQFGKRISTVPISGEIVFFGDNSSSPTLGCGNSKVNLTGKIVLIERGVTLTPACSYALKVKNAQDSGAIACIIGNATTGSLNAINDTFPALANAITIPVLTLNSTNYVKIRSGISGIQGTIQRSPIDTVGADLIDGDLDNGIIAHEFGHGISIRLTGGPANSSCLNLGEQMGEGWSDFMALILTAKPGDRGAKKRGIGTFALRQATDSVGIRRFSYSTDMAIDPHTYNNIFLSQTSPHPIGEIWASTLWDLYWAFVDKYGWDANIYNTQSGNGKAIQLVFDGMKLQVCNPGFIDGRNAILAADRADFNGENQCLIWEVFARRGVGYSALGGRGQSASDNEEAFDVLPTCSKRIEFTKTMTDTILPGGEFLVTLKAVNNKGFAAKDVKIIDSIPLGATVLGVLSVSASSSTAPIAVSFGSNNPVSVQMADSLKNGDSLVVVYRLRSDPARKSIPQWFEGFERDTILFTPTILSGIRRWTVIDTVKNNGLKSIYARAGTVTEQVLTLKDSFLVVGKQPVLRFLHRHNTEGGLDGGIVETFVEGDSIWRETAKLMFKNKTTGLTYLTFPFTTRAFWGNVPQFRPTYVDLSGFKGKNVRIRFRFKSTTASSSTGWMLDDVLMMDMENYNATARLTTSQGDNLTIVADARGTIVEPAIIQVGTKELVDSEVSVFPNPTDNLLTVNVNTSSDKAVLVLRTIQGQEIFRQTISAQQSQTPLSMAGLANGLYFLSVETERGKVVKKVVKQ